MTERLSRLMHAEVDALDNIPAPLDDAGHGPSAAQAAQPDRCGGRGDRSRGSRLRDLVVGEPAGGHRHRPGDAPQRSRPPAYGVGSRVVIGDVVAQVPDSVHSLHYTSVGVLVRSETRTTAPRTAPGPESLTLVHDDGSTVDLGTVPEGVGPATDPEQPYYALAERSGDGFEARCSARCPDGRRGGAGGAARSTAQLLGGSPAGAQR